MRLLHTRDLVLEDFTEREIPSYAILSHRWGQDEVTYQELCCLRQVDRDKRETLKLLWNVSDAKEHGEGYKKITRICAFAQERNHTWIWIDTCCINKESSADLSEAINSMFNWYRKASVCFAYLADVRLHTEPHKEHILRSDWFSRGWTLQGLLAPNSVVFLDADFEIIGSKSDLEDAISTTTGIDRDVIGGRKSILEESIATRMSWAARRITTRTEDLAYSLLGIFNINMPLLYGEGMKAFRRLQEEIIRSSDDETIFVHTYALLTGPKALAHHPRNFLPGSGKLLNGLPNRFSHTSIGSASYTVTNKGVQMRIAFVEVDEVQPGVFLNCHAQASHYPVILLITPMRQGDPFSSHTASSKFSQASQNSWRIRVHTAHEKDIQKAKKLVDEALQRQGDPFEYDIIYLR